jgi:hypothetical protein
MEEEITTVDDYVDWFKWVSNAEKRKQAMFESTCYAKILVLLQVHQVESNGLNNNSTGQLASSNNDEMNTRWREICQRIRVDPNLDKEKKQQLWKVLECYQDFFA